MTKWKFCIFIFLIVLIGILPATAAPVVDFTGSPLSGSAPLTVTFTDNSTGSDPLTYAWDFDNNGINESTLQNPVHAYNDAGIYTVKLTVIESDGSYSDEI